ncbi:Ig-like domain-containing protein [Vogesella alkaliphila]|nr:Ig-like domain-containing protein [Vogesella alkaliphila]
MSIAAAPAWPRLMARGGTMLSLVLTLFAAPGMAQSSKALPQNQGTATAAAAVEREGELEVIHVHYFDKSTGNRYYLKTEEGRVELKFKGKGPRQPSGTRVRVKGSLSNNVLALDSTTSYQVLALATSNTFGDQKTAVLLVNFQDNQTQPYTVSQANTTVFGSSSDFIKENSSQQTWLSGNVYGWLTLPINQTCSPDNVAAYANQAAKNAGIDLTQYPRRIYVMPKNSACTWSGMGTVGGAPSSSWLNGSLYRGVVTHEMGHNLGLWHSHSLDCGATTLGSSCNRSEYGDAFDTMGNGGVHYNAFQKERLGWLNYNTSPAIATVESGSTTVTLAPYAAAGSGTKALKVLKGVDATTGQKSWYYVEFRQPLGFDSDISRFPWAVNGVLVRTGTDNSGDTSDLLDLTPNSSATDDISDSPLAVGKTFTDSGSGVSISLLSASSSGATVSVATGGQPPAQPVCTRGNPSVALTPGQSPSVAAGTAVNFSLSVTNTDSSACSSSQFSLAATLPAGWSSLPLSTLTLAPGASTSTTLSVTSATTAAAGSYGLSVVAANVGSTTYRATAAATYVVASGTTSTSNKPPVAVNDGAATKIGTAVKVVVLGNDYDPEGKPLQVKTVGVPARGKAVLNSDGSVTYTPNGKFKGSDSFSYSISDGAATASAVVSVQVSR